MCSNQIDWQPGSPVYGPTALRPHITVGLPFSVFLFQT